MDRITSPTAARTYTIPASLDGTPGFFTEGNPATGQPATVVSSVFLNAVQEELIAVIKGAGLTPDFKKNDQLWQAISSQSMTGGRLIDSIILRGSTGGAWHPPSGTRRIRVYVQGGGGGGGGTPPTTEGKIAAAPGGGGGGCAIDWVVLEDTRMDFVYSLGVGGAGGATTTDGGYTTAGNGSPSTFQFTNKATGVVITLTGHGGTGASSAAVNAEAGAAQLLGGAGGKASGAGFFNIRGQSGGRSLYTVVNNSCSGAGGKGYFFNPTPEVGGSSHHGVDGDPGCGGSGSVSNSSSATGYVGGRGGDGFIMIECYA